MKVNALPLLPTKASQGPAVFYVNKEISNDKQWLERL